MKHELKKVANSAVEIKICLTAEEVKPVKDEVLKELAKKVEVPGFRKGHVPVSTVEAQFKDAVKEEVTDKVLHKYYEEVIKAENIMPISYINNVKANLGEEFDVTFTVDVYPEVTLGEYKGLEVEKETFEMTPEKLDAEITMMVNSKSKLEETEAGYKAQMGDTVDLAFEGFVDGVAFEGGKAEGHNLVIGSGSFIPGFEDQLIGKKAGEEVDVNVTFPVDYHAEELAGAPVVFKVKVNAVKVKELPELNDEFAQDTTEFETLAELKADLKAKAEEEAAAKAKSEERNAVVEAVVANTEVEVPETMVNAQIDSSIMELNYSLQYQGFSIEQLLEMTGKSMQELRDERKEDAEKSVKASLVVDAIAKAENVEVSEEEVEAEVAKMAEAYNMTLPQIKEALKSNDLEDIKGQLRIRKTIDFLVENAVIA